MKLEVLAICVAYEQGYGHGLKKRDLTNPYHRPIDLRDDYEAWEGEGRDTSDAWAYGYDEGYRHAVDCVGGEE